MARSQGGERHEARRHGGVVPLPTGARPRACSRARRRIPPSVLRSVFNKVPSSIEKLKPIVDEFIEVDNDHPTQPRLRSPAHVRAFLRLARDVRDSPDERGSDSRGMSSLESWLPAAFSNGRAQGTGGSA